ncbi:MAG TPA: serine protease [Candidatus Kaiserbacteria bacterium]|nr:serine protease [Candidatus Kaiserbacteria bacterium]
MKSFGILWLVILASIAGLWLSNTKPFAIQKDLPASKITLATTTKQTSFIKSPEKTRKAFIQTQKSVSTTSKAKTSPETKSTTPKRNTYIPEKDLPQDSQKTNETQTLISTQAQLSASAIKLRSALVNIICTTPAGGRIRSISGSGIVVGSRGVILTNAHIGQYFLLHDYPSKGNTVCNIRTGSPARNTYSAKLMFISPSWMDANPGTLTQYAPTGTGKYDIAFLLITKSLTDKPLPKTFSFIPLAKQAPKKDDDVVIGSYAAQFLTTNQINYSLYPTITYGNVKNIFTFDTNTVDVISLGGSAAAQEGSSGGGIINANCMLTGIITTSTTKGDTDTRDLHAITATYVRRDYKKETNYSIDDALNNPQTTTDMFSSEASALSAILVKKLTQTP